MRINPKTNLLMLLALAVVALFINSCRTDNVDVPPLTGPSGQRLFLTIQAEPDHLVIRGPGKSREKSTIIVQLKNQLGQGVPNETVKLRIANKEGSEINIGRLSSLTGVTDAGGFIRVTYTAPNTLEQPVGTRIYILAIMTNPSFVNEVTDIHALDLEFAQPPINCVGGGAGAPVPDFTVTPSSPAVNEVACFDAQSSTDNGIITAAGWNFGDGSTGTGLNVCHTFTHEGRFNVTLTIQDDDHNCASVTQVVEVTNEGPTCAFTFSPSDPQINENVQFNAAESTDPESNVNSFQWNFGDGGTASGKIANHTYTSEGTFTVTLTVRDNQGESSVCTQTITIGNQPPVCSFTINPTGTINPGDTVTLDASSSSDPDHDPLTFEWSTPGASETNGSTETFDVTYSKVGTFNVTLIVSDGTTTSSCSQTVIVGNTPPVCTSFSADNTTITAGDTVTFTAAGNDPDGGAVTFNFTTPGGNPPSGSGTPFATVYNTAGSFSASASVTDNEGTTTACTGTISITVNSPTGTAPTAVLAVVGSNNVCQGQSVAFDGSGSHDNDAFGAPPQLVTFSFDFGDGNSIDKSTSSASHTYNTSGSFQASLTVTDNEGDSSSPDFEPITVSPTPSPASVNSVTDFCAGNAFSIIGTNLTGVNAVVVDGVTPLTINGTPTATTVQINATGVPLGANQDHPLTLSNASCTGADLVVHCP